MTHVAREERHLVGADDEQAAGVGDRLDRDLDVAARDLARGLLDVHVVRGDRRLERVLVEREERRGRAAAADLAGGDAAPVLLDRRVLELGEALEAERLREAHDRRARGVRAARELLGRLEGDLVEVVDDVLRDVLLRARELVEPRLDVRGEGLVAAGLMGRGRGRRRRALHGRTLVSTAACTFLPRHRPPGARRPPVAGPLGSRAWLNASSSSRPRSRA